MSVIQAVYIHIPFCLKKCHYCDFLSFSDVREMEHYINALILEMQLTVKNYTVRAETIFIGGGTPSCLPELLLERLLQSVQQYFVTPALKEYTMEGNPGTLTEKKLQLMRQFGVNRLSLGVQSDRAEHLQMLGRIHSFVQAEEAVLLAKAVGFTNINLDFMYGLPNQTVEQWQQTLQNAISLKPQHLSLYQLKIEADTLFAHWLKEGKIEEFDDETALQMYRMSQHMLAEHGFQQYEISNYALPGYSSIHNQVYWRTENYIGLGLGACSWIRPLRCNNHHQLEQYVMQLEAGELPRQAAEQLTELEQMEETVFMALRMNQGIAKQSFQQRFGKPLEQIFCEALQRCQEKGWLTESEQQFVLTETGRVLGNLVFLEFISE